MTHSSKEKRKEYDKRYYDKHKEKILEHHKEYRNKNKKKVLECNRKYNKSKIDVIRNRQLKHNFGITLEQYNEIFIIQNGCCDICGRHQSEFSKALVVDHDHKTGKIRGLLYDNCNHGIGNFKDNIETLQKAINYLQ